MSSCRSLTTGHANRKRFLFVPTGHCKGPESRTCYQLNRCPTRSRFRLSSEQNTEKLRAAIWILTSGSQPVRRNSKIRRRLLATFSRGLVCYPEKKRHAKLGNALDHQFTIKLIRIAFGPNSGQPVRRSKTQTSLWPSEQNFKSTSTACVSAGGYSFSRKGIARRNCNQGTRT